MINLQEAFEDVFQPDEGQVEKAKERKEEFLQSAEIIIDSAVDDADNFLEYGIESLKSDRTFSDILSDLHTDFDIETLTEDNISDFYEEIFPNMISFVKKNMDSFYSYMRIQKYADKTFGK